MAGADPTTWEAWVRHWRWASESLAAKGAVVYSPEIAPPVGSREQVLALVGPEFWMWDVFYDPSGQHLRHEGDTAEEWQAWIGV